MKHETGTHPRSGRETKNGRAVALRAARTTRGAWRRFVTIVLSALVVVSVLDVVLLVRADGAHMTTLAWLWLPVALSVAARRAYRLPGAEARVG